MFATIPYVGKQVSALVIFVDIRGFTAWSDHHEVASHLDDFVEGFERLLEEHFPASTFHAKSTGDGAMLVKELETDLLQGDRLDELLKDALDRIVAFERGFVVQCSRFGERVGQPSELPLGWGITRGHAWRVRNDFYSANVNKAARICDAARPSGIVISKADFPRLPNVNGFVFEEQARVLRGLDLEKVWITSVAARGLSPREQVREMPEVHVAGVCIDQKPSLRLLLARRAANRELYPGRWEGCGGQLKLNDTFVEGVRRHFRAEMKMDVEPIEDVHCFYTINQANTSLIPGIRFLCARVDTAEPAPIPDRHSEIRWITEKDFKALPERELIPGFREEVLLLLKQFKSIKRAKP